VARIVVDDGLRALQDLATAVRRRAAVKVVGITGSAGKTSAKDILKALLQPVARTVATTANLNNEIGVPLTLLQVEPSTEVAVVEMAMRGVGQIRELARVAEPDVGVITNIAPVHLELVGTIEDVAAAKAELIEELTDGGTAVVPADEQLLDRHVRRHRGRVVTFGGDDADVHIVAQERRGESTHVLLDAFGHRARMDFSFTGDHYLRDALAAVAAFVELGYRLDEAAEGAARVAFSDLRGALSPLPGGGLLLNDAYNANPVAMNAAVDHLVAIADGRPTVAVLGDMYELGPGAGAYHRAVGEHCAAAGVRLVAVGGLARDYLTGAPDERWFASVDECLQALPEVAPPGSAVLVKASRLMRMERVAEALADPGAHRA
jgi:UDP-N-acetylmuramoyl-tripeptide--D-alanyl-D-alanine ligase